MVKTSRDELGARPCKISLWQSGNHDRELFLDFRPMTLRRRVFPVLPFGWSVDPDQRNADFRFLALRRRLSAVLLFSAVWQS
jgi:hypothetical protein